MTTPGPPRELRGLVPVELALIVAAALVPLPIPVVIPLLVIGSLSLWVRGRSWLAVMKGPRVAAVIGAGAGLVALALALAVGTPVVEGITDQAVQWSMYPIIRGSPTAFAILSVLVVLSAVAAELVLRGYLVERLIGVVADMRDVSPKVAAVAAVVIAAAVEALLVFPIGQTDSGPLQHGGDLTARIGAGIFGLAMGWMYLAGGRSVVAPLCARIAFSLGALALEAARLVG